jgi:hypothetical protein
MQILLTCAMSCHVIYPNYGIFYPVVTHSDSTVSCRKYIYHAKYEPCLDWKAGASQKLNPKILRNDMFHNGDTVPYCTTTITHPPKNNQSQRKVHPVHDMTAYVGWRVRYGVNRSHLFRRRSDAFCGVSFVSFGF